MLRTKEDFDLNEIVHSAWELIEFVVTKYKVTRFNEFKCPFMRALAEDLLDEVEEE